MNTSFELFPPHASAMSWNVDWLLLYMTVITVFFTVLIFVLIVYYGLKYRARPGHRPWKSMLRWRWKSPGR
jgi:heme/copper-type cytochrome/quinol oxidase subunit 2